jgi:hypothetical protein
MFLPELTPLILACWLVDLAGEDAQGERLVDSWQLHIGAMRYHAVLHISGYEQAQKSSDLDGFGLALRR